MGWQKVVCLLLLALLCLSAAVGVTVETASTNGGNLTRPNVLMIIADDLRSQLGGVSGVDDAGGLVQTPHISNLSKEGTVFTHAYAQESLCGPSRNSFLSGRRPDTTRSWQFLDHFREEGNEGNGRAWTALPQHFKENGYVVVGAGKVYHKGLPPNWDMPYSWDSRMHDGTWEPWLYPTEPPCPNKTSWCAVPRESLVNGTKVEVAVFEDDQTVSQAVRLLENITELYYQHREGEALPLPPPWFLAVGFRKPHLNWRFPAEFLEMYPTNLSQIPLPAYPLLPEGNADLGFHMPVSEWYEGPSDVVGECAAASFGAVSSGAGPREWSFPPPCQAAWRRAYWAATSYMDDCVGKVVSAVDRLGFTDNTVVVFFGDHGWSLGELNVWEKFTNYEAGTRTPLIVKVPQTLLRKLANNGQRQQQEHDKQKQQQHDKQQHDKQQHDKQQHDKQQHGKQQRQRPLVHELVELVDVFPTLVELARLPTPDDSDGGGGAGGDGSAAADNVPPPPLAGKSLVPLLLAESGSSSLLLSDSSNSGVLEGGVQGSNTRSGNGNGGGGDNGGDEGAAGATFDLDFEAARVALSQFPRCVNGLQYSELPLSEFDTQVWSDFGLGQPPPSLEARTKPSLPWWDLTDCNDVSRHRFTHMGLSMRVQSRDCRRGWRLTIWYEWDRETLSPRWSSKRHQARREEEGRGSRDDVGNRNRTEEGQVVVELFFHDETPPSSPPFSSVFSQLAVDIKNKKSTDPSSSSSSSSSRSSSASTDPSSSSSSSSSSIGASTGTGSSSAAINLCSSDALGAGPGWVSGVGPFDSPAETVNLAGQPQGSFYAAAQARLTSKLEAEFGRWG